MEIICRDLLQEFSPAVEVAPSACSSSALEGIFKEPTFYIDSNQGPPADQARIYYVVSDTTTDICSSPPTSFGWQISSELLNDPPADATSFVFTPADAIETWSPIQYATLDWNPQGHAGPGYDVPHFDFHAYLVPQSEVESITAGPCAAVSPDSFYQANLPIMRSCFPSTDGSYQNLGAVEPNMGNHLISTVSPEFAAMAQGQNASESFTHTFIYGVYGGEITFLEPMITQTYLESTESRGEMCWPIPGVPENLPEEGWLPTEYCILPGADGAVKVELRSFKTRPGGCTGPYADGSFLQMPPGSPQLPPKCDYPSPE